eukprot:g8403.t1
MVVRTSPHFLWEGFIRGALNIDDGIDITDPIKKVKEWVEMMDADSELKALMAPAHQEEANDEAEDPRTVEILDGIVVDKDDSENDEPLAPVTTSNQRSVKKRILIIERLLEDMLVGLGVNEKVVLRREDQNQEHSVFSTGIDTKLSELSKKFRNKMSTHSQYSKYINLFLLWANKMDPSMWNKEGAILVTEGTLYSFLKKYETGEVRLTGVEPFFGDVVRGKVEYNISKLSSKVGSETIKKVINALTVLASTQQDLLHLAREKPRDFDIVKNFEANAVTNIATHRRKYATKVFRSSKSPSSQIQQAHAVYNQRAKLRDELDLLNMLVGNHYDKHAGAAIARIYNVRETEIENLGLWEPKTCQRFYLKLRPVDTIAKMSGFSSPQNYYINRAQVDPFNHPELQQYKCLFHGFMPFLDDQLSCSGAGTSQNRKSRHNALINAVSALKFLRRVFWQDAALLYLTHQNLQIFSCSLIEGNKEGFLKFVELVNGSVEAAHQEEQSGSQKIPFGFMDVVKDLKKQQSITNAKIDVLLRNQVKCRAQLDDCEKNSAKKIKTNEVRNDQNGAMTNKDVTFIKWLRPLNDDMTLEKVFLEWSQPFKNEGVTMPPMKELHKAHKCLGARFYDLKLKSAIRRRKDICEWLERLADSLGSIALALEEAKRYRMKINKNGKEASLMKHTLVNYCDISM